VAILCATTLSAQGQERGPSPVSPQDLRAAIDRLGDIDYDTRTGAARLVRRTPAPQAVPALLQAAQDHADGYVRYKSLVLLTGFDDPRTADQMIEVLGSPNEYLSLLSSLSMTDKKTLLVMGENKKNIVLSGRNIHNTKVITAGQINTYDVMNADKLIFIESSVELISNLLNKQ
jgi:hypothetical protein